MFFVLKFLLNKNNVQEQFRENTIKTFSWQLYKHQPGTETVYLHIFDKEEEELEPKPLQSHWLIKFSYTSYTSHPLKL